MSLEKQIELVKQAQRFYMFRDDNFSQKKYAECCDRLTHLYNKQETHKC